MTFVDLHCDTIDRLCHGDGEGLFEAPALHIDLKKLQKSGYLLQSFALFVNLQKNPDPWAKLLCMAERFRHEMELNSKWMTQVRTAEDLYTARKNKKIAAVLTVEEGGVCQGRAERLAVLYDLGVRMLTLTWNYANELGQPNGKRGGLTPVGFVFLEEMERLGILADVSHLGDDGFWDVCRHATKPFVASHSCCRALCDHPRNLTDEMIRAIAGRGGLIGVNFYAKFLGTEPVSTIENILRHVRHMINVGGLDAVALGTDFDGIDCPLALQNAGEMGRLADAMQHSGFTAREIEAVCWKNAWRFLCDRL